MVIVGVLLVLAAILWPVSTGSPRSPKKQCLSNVKQLAVGHLIYISDYDDRFPNRDDWMDAIQPYTKNEGIFRCPVVAESKDPHLYGYCFHSILSNAKLPAHPETVELVFESISRARNASGNLESLPKPGRHKSSKGGFNNIAYADGHVKDVKMP